MIIDLEELRKLAVEREDAKNADERALQALYAAQDAARRTSLASAAAKARFYAYCDRVAAEAARAART